MLSLKSNRRSYWEFLYRLLYKKEEKGVLLIFQEVGLGEEEYLFLKEVVLRQGGSMIRLRKEEVDLFPFSSLLSCSPLWVFFPTWKGFSWFLALKEEFQLKNCFLLFLFHGMRMHYEMKFCEFWKRREEKERIFFFFFRKKIFCLFFSRKKQLLKIKCRLFIN